MFDCGNWTNILNSSGGGGGGGSEDINPGWISSFPESQRTPYGTLYINDNKYVQITGPKLPFTLTEQGGKLYLTYNGTTYVMDQAVTPPTPPTPTVQYTVTTVASPVGSGVVSGAGRYNDGSVATLTASPNSGYVFDHWNLGAGRTSTSNPYNLTVTEDVTITAVFLPDGGGTVTSTCSINPNVYVDGNLIKGWDDYVDITPGLTVGYGEDITLGITVRNTKIHSIDGAYVQERQRMDSGDSGHDYQSVYTITIQNVVSDMQIYIYLSIKEYPINVTHMDAQSMT